MSEHLELSPDHLEDLHRSGLTSDTIKACRFASIRPHDINISGVESAYEIPYFQLDRTVNCLTRWRLFPPVKTESGTWKYHQPVGSDPHIYLPPLLNWTEVATDTTTPVVICEGEKKSAALCQAGIAALGIAGTWTWRQKLDTGERLMIPTLDLFHWKGRVVEIVPDSDGWKPSKQLDVLAGFFTLAKMLWQRKAVVKFIVLYDDRGRKVGPDDFLVKTGGTWRTDWEALQRLQLDSPELKKVSSWWQKWNQKQLDEDERAQPSISELNVDEMAGLYTITATKHGVRLLFNQLVDMRGGVSCELTVYHGKDDLVPCADISLKNPDRQKKLAFTLSQDRPAIPWRVLLTRACALVLQRHRRGEPVIDLSRDSVAEHLRYVINPFVYDKKTTVVFGDGGQGKSTWALLMAMQAATGQTIAGVRAQRVKPLILDYEDDDDIHQLRVHALINGHPELRDAVVKYQRACRPVHAIVPQLAHYIQAEGIRLLVIDSLFAASGGQESDHCQRFFAAIRPLKIAVLVLGHTPKPQDGLSPSIFGSVFNKNYSRMVWELKREPIYDGGPARIGLYHKKDNYSPDSAGLGFLVTQEQDYSAFRYEAYDLSQAAELKTAALPVASQIRNFLERDGSIYTSREISEATGLTLETVKATLSKHKGIKWQMIGENKDAKWTVLKDRK